MRKSWVALVFLLLAGITTVGAQNKKTAVHAIGFYNLENLFDTCHDVGHNDYEYLPSSKTPWNTEKYLSKLRHMSQALADMGTDVVPGGCAAIGVAEVENSHCLDDLCNQPELKKRNMKYVHIEGPDHRGIDCALLYNPAIFQVRNVKLIPYIYLLPQDSARATRGFLAVSGTMAGEHVTIVVNHLPSRGAPSYYREQGGLQLHAVKDSLLADDPKVKLLIMGDMNDDPCDSSMAVALGAKREMAEVEADGLYNPWWKIHDTGTGTLYYRGNWNLFDQILLSSSLLNQKGKKRPKTLKLHDAQIFRRDYLIQQDGPFKGAPLRTHAGGRWLNGYSDHLPTVVYLVKKAKQ